MLRTSIAAGPWLSDFTHGRWSSDTCSQMDDPKPASARLAVLAAMLFQNVAYTLLRRYSQGVLHENYSYAEVLVLAEVAKTVVAAAVACRGEASPLATLAALVRDSRQMLFLAIVYATMNLLSIPKEEWTHTFSLPSHFTVTETAELTRATIAGLPLPLHCDAREVPTQGLSRRSNQRSPPLPLEELAFYHQRLPTARTGTKMHLGQCLHPKAAAPPSPPELRCPLTETCGRALAPPPRAPGRGSGG